MDPRSTSSGDDPRSSSTVVVGFLGALVLFVIVVFLQAVYYQVERGERAAKTETLPYEEWSRVRAEQETSLNSYSWVDRDKGVVAIPIERAMDLVAREAAGEVSGAPGAGR